MMSLTGERHTLLHCRRLPVGAETIPHGGVHVRVWAPAVDRAEVVLEGGPGAPSALELDAEPNGYFSGLASEAGPGSRMYTMFVS